MWMIEAKKDLELRFEILPGLRAKKTKTKQGKDLLEAQASSLLGRTPTRPEQWRHFHNEAEWQAKKYKSLHFV